MSWDIVLFNSREKIEFIEDLDENGLETTDFCKALENHFDNIVADEDHREIKGRDFTIDYFLDDEPVSNKMVSIYGENGLFELVVLARKQNWQIFDTQLGHMIDLDNPANNGYEHFHSYIK